MNNGSKIPMISFIIPVLNGEKYIGRCLNHIINEAKPSDEIIVVDNGSTDNTVKIVREYRDVRLLEFPDVTIAALRNRGAEIAKGAVLAFIDSDCLVCRGWREAVEEILADDSVKATGSHYDIPEQSTWVERAWYQNKKKSTTPTDFIASGNFVIRKDIFKGISGFNEKLITDEDTDISARLVEEGYHMVDAPGVRVIHLGNAKTIREFYKKKKWHSTSIIDTWTFRKPDKPMIMTLVFMASFLLSFISLLFFCCTLIQLWLLGLVFLAPLLSAFYRVSHKGKMRYFFQIIILYFIFYFSRSIVILKITFRRLFKERKMQF